jgi:hypothetical protein
LATERFAPTHGWMVFPCYNGHEVKLHGVT